MAVSEIDTPTVDTNLGHPELFRKPLRYFFPNPGEDIQLAHPNVPTELKSRALPQSQTAIIPPRLVYELFLGVVVGATIAAIFPHRRKSRN